MSGDPLLLSDEEIAGLTPAEQAEYERLLEEERHDWSQVARPDQLEPDGEWSIWVMLGGRGAGKSRSLSEALRRRVREGLSRESSLVGATAADARDVMIEGPAGVLACCTDQERPDYQPSRRRLAWPNGAVTHVYSADEPERLRGPQHDFAIGDELRAWRYLREALDNLLLGLRMGPDPRACFATTPSARRELRELLGRAGVVVTRASTLANLDNLSGTFRERVLARYEGTRLGAQEIHGELIEQAEGALWERAWFERPGFRASGHPEWSRRPVVGADPSDGTATGNRHAYVVAGLGLKYPRYFMPTTLLLLPIVGLGLELVLREGLRRLPVSASGVSADRSPPS